ncbi:uncharacterized protein LOC117653519 isoform X2 [Thrips palmi]|uniref:Uncharacterized protein LOC117653519 isoform X2 n=1 Tax=Thrips palmi TaxID=161013 RepID=A0A6P9AAP5_THRPL|nr:uncharacterized protein LOC117653519 isoform X2 [Thrips palmi]
MPKSRREVLDDLKELRNAGRRSLDVLEGEFQSILKWCRDVLDTIQSEDFSPCDLRALFPIPKVSKEATTNNNELSCTSLEAALPTQVEEPHGVNISASSSTKSMSSSVDNSTDSDPDKKSKKVPTRSSQRINRNKAVKEDEANLHECSASSSSSEASSSASARVKVNVTKIKPVRIKPSTQLIKSTTAKPGPASKKLLKGTPTLSGLGPKKVLKGTPSMAGQPVKKVLKGTPSMAGQEPVKKVLKGTPSMAGPGPAQSKLLRGTPTSSRDGLALRKLFNNTKEKSKATTNQNLFKVEDGPLSKCDYVHEVAQKGFSHLAKLKDLVNPGVGHDSLIKHTNVVEDPRKTFVIAPFDEKNATFVLDSARSSDVANATFVLDSARSSDVANATFVLDSARSSNVANATFDIDPSDKIQNAKEKVLKGLGNLTTDEDLVKTGGVAHGSDRSVVKDLNATYDVASYDLTLDPAERPPLPSKNEDDYGLDDVCSDDSSDDESNPKKVVPTWAQVSSRQSCLSMQRFVSQSQTFAFFGPAKTLDLTQLFSTSNIDKRMLIRRSSAVWPSPDKSGH